MADKIYMSLQEKYKKLGLSKAELAQELGLGVSTISKRMAEGLDLPNYKKLGSASNARVIFPLVDVAKYISTTVEVN